MRHLQMNFAISVRKTLFHKQGSNNSTEFHYSSNIKKVFNSSQRK